MRAHDDGFLRRVRPGLVEDRVGNADLADIVQRCGIVEQLAGRLVESVQASEHGRELADPAHVVRGFARARFGGAGKQVEHVELAVEQLLVEVQVFVGDRDVAAEDLHELVAMLVELVRFADVEQGFAGIAVGEMQHVVVVGEDMLLLAEGAMQRLHHVPGQFFLGVARQVARILAAGRGDLEMLGQGAVRVRDAAAQRAAFDADQFGQLWPARPTRNAADGGARRPPRRP